MKLRHIIPLTLVSLTMACTEPQSNQEHTPKTQIECSMQKQNPASPSYDQEIRQAITREKQGVKHTLASYKRAIEDLHYLTSLSMQDEQLRREIQQKLPKYEDQLEKFKNEMNIVLNSEPEHHSLVGIIRVRFKDLSQAVSQTNELYLRDIFSGSSKFYAKQREKETAAFRAELAQKHRPKAERLELVISDFIQYLSNISYPC